jgi:hypothetical protein
MADSQDPNAPAPRPYWQAPGEPIGPPMEQIPAEHPPHWDQPYGAPPGGQWAPQFGNWAGQRPANNLMWAVLSLLFFWPLGVTAIYYATRVNGRWEAGDHAGAQYAAERAKKFAIASVVVGVIALAFVFAMGGPQG